ncbi:unnamed protein product [Microthlaspi erraticum]|uniref:Retrovirus-related Pol polyprotein from transposon TNT 1-94-like beta-barrel domain-containing protein n=1 Tax=Microthlaspi erraticum TaxID=1685480 RepID=A0A6D2HFR2_9BRAS|nr:unnamed protein product [Microthlaspi erraticum]
MAAASVHDAVSDDFDYEMWAPTMKTTLVEKKLWDVVENGVSPDPTKIPELAATIKVEELAQWRNRVIKDIQALKLIQSSLTDSAFRKTISVDSAKNLWDLLEKGNEEAKLRRLEKQFEELRMGEKESIDSYSGRVTEIVEQLRRLKIEKSDYDVVTKVLASLSASYDGVAPVLGDLMDLKSMTLKSLVEVLQGYDSMKIEDIDRALKLNRLKYESRNKKNHIPKAEEYGRQCYRRKQDKDGEETMVDYILMAKLSLGDFTYDEDMWMIYGHSTSHMTPYEKLFAGRLDKTVKAKVGLVDGTVIMAEGLGEVKVVMKNGKTKTISPVLFVPRGINRNVLSVKQMQSRGCSFDSGERGECIVRDKSGAVFGDTLWDERGLSIRLEVVQGNLKS